MVFISRQQHLSNPQERCPPPIHSVSRSLPDRSLRCSHGPAELLRLSLPPLPRLCFLLQISFLSSVHTDKFSHLEYTPPLSIYCYNIICIVLVYYTNHRTQCVYSYCTFGSTIILCISVSTRFILFLVHNNDITGIRE